MEVRILPPAEADLDRLVEFIAETQGSLIAQEVFDLVLNKISLLKRNPFSNPVERLAGKAPYHKLTVNKRTIVLYRIEVDAIEVHEIKPARSDWKK